MKLKLCTLGLLLALGASQALGQCSQCYTSAAAASKQGQKAMARAVTVLLIPPVGIMGVLIGVAFRYRNRHEELEQLHLDREA